MIKIKKLIVLFSILAAIGIGGYFAFQHYFIATGSDLDAKSSEQQKQELLTNEKYKDLPEVIALKQQVNEAENKGDELSKGTSNRKTSQAEIENNLKQKLAALQGEYNGKLGGLIGSAKSEYMQIKSGKKSGSTSELASKYLGQGVRGPV